MMEQSHEQHVVPVTGHGAHQVCFNGGFRLFNVLIEGLDIVKSKEFVLCLLVVFVLATFFEAIKCALRKLARQAVEAEIQADNRTNRTGHECRRNGGKSYTNKQLTRTGKKSILLEQDFSYSFPDPCCSGASASSRLVQGHPYGVSTRYACVCRQTSYDQTLKDSNERDESVVTSQQQTEQLVIRRDEASGRTETADESELQTSTDTMEGQHENVQCGIELKPLKSIEVPRNENGEKVSGEIVRPEVQVNTSISHDLSADANRIERLDHDKITSAEEEKQVVQFSVDAIGDSGSQTKNAEITDKVEILGDLQLLSALDLQTKHSRCRRCRQLKCGRLVDDASLRTTKCRALPGRSSCPCCRHVPRQTKSSHYSRLEEKSDVPEDDNHQGARCHHNHSGSLAAKTLSMDMEDTRWLDYNTALSKTRVQRTCKLYKEITISMNSKGLKYHLVSAIVYTLQVVFAYVMMLLVMTYNTWILFTVVLGGALGYFIFTCSYCDFKPQRKPQATPAAV
ncbi:uncharacterized protein [Ptychodera flava]|uniref:uncharacterized protein n=1 Tax=Ptychodera flava TaxID=63121 RepID=UPI00396A19A9